MGRCAAVVVLAAATAVLDNCGAVKIQGEAVLAARPTSGDATSIVSGDCLAADCHRPTAEHLARAKIVHPPLKERTCAACHVRHSDQAPPRLLKMPMGDLCFGCHKDLGAKIQSSAYLHQPVRNGDCIACHDPHGADFVQLLKRYPMSEMEILNYGDPFRPLCLKCHDKGIFDAETSTLTGFRNGDRNLHFVHVHRKKGRRCTSCHDVHASSQPAHIRPEVPFGAGKWMLPIQFTLNATGGSCVVGCHRPLGYDRIRPLKIPPSPP